MESVAQQSKRSSDIFAFLDSFNDTWMASKLASLKEMLHPSVVFVTGEWLDQEIIGKDACIQSIEEYTSNATTHDFKVTTKHVHIWGNSATLKYTYEVKYELEGIYFQEKGMEVWNLVHEAGRWQLCWRGLLQTEPTGESAN